MSLQKSNPFLSAGFPYIYYQNILAEKPSLVLEYTNQELTIHHYSQSFKLKMPPKESLEFLEELVENLPKPKFDRKPNSKNHFQYGLLGFFGFEFGLKLMNTKLDIQKLHKQQIPDFYFILPTSVKILDKKLNVIEHYSVQNEKNVFLTPTIKPPTSNEPQQKAKSNLTKKQYFKKFEQIKDLFINGETYQVNFAQKWTTESKKLPAQIFEELTKINPSSHQALLVTPDFSIISNSPESLFIKTKDKLSTYPIKGTLPASENPQKLLDSKKDQAELEMIVDLERNDLGKIAKAGTVKVTKHRYIESYSNVHHTLSEITCQVNKDIKFSQIIQSIFPGGSVTGCPKHRTCQFIHELEPDLREYYCGSIGYLDKSGNAQFNILIRSILNIGTQVEYHSGGGITIQSDPEEEYQETFQKAENLVKILTQ